MDLFINFSREIFITKCLESFKNEKRTIAEDIYNILTDLISNSIAKLKISQKIIFKNKIEYYDQHLALSEYIKQGGIEFWYISFEIYYPKELNLQFDNIIFPEEFELKDINYGGGFNLKTKIKNIFQKKFNKISIELLNLQINSSILTSIYEKIKPALTKQFLLPSKLGVWEWRQTFYDKIDGNIYFCSCFKNVIEKNKDINNSSNIHLKKALKKTVYKDKICHICACKNSDLFYCHPMYGSSFKVKYGAYIEKIKIEQNIDDKTAENIIRKIKGVAKIGEKWINETLLFNYIEVLFPHYRVKRESSPDWLGSQRLDIFIPEINLAIEYQGQQHFKPISLFGGKEGLEKTLERDVEKANKCKLNNIDLIYFTYKEELSEKLVMKKLKKYIR